MKFIQSIRFRIIIACIFFAFIVSIVFGYVFMKSIDFNADEQFNWHIKKELTHLLKEYKNNKDISSRTQRTIITITDEKNIINELVTMMNIDDKFSFEGKKLKELPFKRYDNITEDGYINYEYIYKEKTVAFFQVPLKDSKNLSLYYIIDLTGFEENNDFGSKGAIEIFAISIFIILILSVIIGIYIANKVLSPLTNLTSNVDKIDIGEYKSNLNNYYSDEIGFLAKRIDSFVKSTTKFIQREQAFTRDASHELRTPVASSQAALDVAKELTDDSKILQVLSRIERANKNMTHLIETFLILGREKENKKEKVSFKLKELVNNSLKKNSYLLTSEQITYENRISEELVLSLHKDYLLIIIDNLIRNAFVHMQEGILKISATNNSFIVFDTGEWFKEEKELGIGLNIVKRICKLEEWELTILTIKDEGTKIEIEF